MGIVKPPSMIIDIINVGRVAMVIEAENNAPLGANGDAPKPGKGARQRMQMETG